MTLPDPGVTTPPTDEQPHILHVTIDRCGDCPDEGLCADCQEEPELSWDISCPGVTRWCSLWMECMPCTRAARKDDELSERMHEEPQHGKQHQWIDGMWCVEKPGACIAQWSDNLCDAATDIDAPVGDLPVWVRWENEMLTLERVK